MCMAHTHYSYSWRFWTSSTSTMAAAAHTTLPLLSGVNLPPPSIVEYLLLISVSFAENAKPKETCV